MKIVRILTACFVCLLYSGGLVNAAKGKRGNEIGKKSASKFLNYRDCMKMMKCGPSVHKECAEECKAGNTREEIEEHTERLKNINKYVKDARDAKRMSKREDTDLSDSTTDDEDSCEEDGKSGAAVCRLSEKIKQAKLPDKHAARFLSYKECMRRMNCGKQLKKECAEECKEGNTEEEVEEHGSFLRNINKYIEEAKRRKKAKDLETTSSESSESDETSTNDDTDTSTDDDNTSDTTDDTSDTSAEKKEK